MSVLFDLTPAESLLIEAVKRGDMLDFCHDNSEAGIIPAADWGHERVIRAEVIIRLFLGELTGTKLYYKGIRIKGARIVGQLDFEAMNLSAPLTLLNCWIEEEVNLTNAAAINLDFSGSRLKGINGEGLALKGSFHITKGFKCNGKISLRNAVVKGSIYANQGQIINPHNYALDGTRLTVEGSAYFINGFYCEGGICLIDAQINGVLSFLNAELRHPKHHTIEASRATIKSTVFLNGKFKSYGKVTFTYGQIGGSVECQGGYFENNGNPTLNFAGAAIKGSVFLSDNFISKGIVFLSFANIGGKLECITATFENPGGLVLKAVELNTGNTCIFKNVTVNDGGLDISGSNIKGSLIFQGGSYNSSVAFAIKASQAVVNHYVSFSNGFTSNNSIDLSGISIGGSLEFAGASIKVQKGYAVNAHRMSAKGDVILKDRFTSTGRISFNAAKIGANFNANGSVMTSESPITFDAERLQVGSDFYFKEVVVQGQACLRNAEIGSDAHFHKTKITSGSNSIALNAFGLSVKGSLMLMEGFTAIGAVGLAFAKIKNDLVCTKAILKCPLAQPVDGMATNSSPINYVFFAHNMVVDGTFHWLNVNIEEGAEIVLGGAHVGWLADDLASWPKTIKIMIDNFTYSSISPHDLGWKQRLYWIRLQKKFSRQPYEQAIKVLKSMGHEKDARILSLAKKNDLRVYGQLSRMGKLGSWILNWTIGHGYQVWRVLIISLLIITLGAFLFNWAHNLGVMVPVKEKGPAYPWFQPVYYSLDVFLPIVDLKQDTYWLPVGPGKHNAFFMIYLWFQIIAGWILTTLGIAGLTGIIKKD